MSKRIVTLNEEVIKGEIRELVRAKRRRKKAEALYN